MSVTRRAALLIAAATCTAPLPAAAPALAGPPAALAVVAPAAEPATVPPLAAAPLTAVLAAAEPVPGPPGQGQPQPPNDLIFVEVTPSTVEVGFLVGIRASCRENSVPAIVASDAFGRIQVQPQRGLLTASPMVKERTRPGNYRVKLECPSGQTASTMLQVVKAAPSRTAAPPSRGPATGFGGTAGSGLGNLLVPGGLALIVAGAVVGVTAARRPRTVRGTARR
ncbi:hypothetical protein ABZ570_27805 [Micromonospora sp. NPDC007271]|uniref:hypothetical protein n=1 Tax=Micromonospora sp. NPDC007271 TaxID=3154587 RepID=UPI0033D2F7A7